MVGFEESKAREMSDVYLVEFYQRGCNWVSETDGAGLPPLPVGKLQVRSEAIFGLVSREFGTGEAIGCN
jgi:hypothetical protein